MVGLKQTGFYWLSDVKQASCNYNKSARASWNNPHHLVLCALWRHSSLPLLVLRFALVFVTKILHVHRYVSCPLLCTRRRCLLVPLCWFVTLLAQGEQPLSAHQPELFCRRHYTNTYSSIHGCPPFHIYSIGLEEKWEYKALPNIISIFYLLLTERTVKN